MSVKYFISNVYCFCSYLPEIRHAGNIFATHVLRCQCLFLKIDNLPHMDDTKLISIIGSTRISKHGTDDNRHIAAQRTRHWTQKYNRIYIILVRPHILIKHLLSWATDELFENTFRNIANEQHWNSFCIIFNTSCTLKRKYHFASVISHKNFVNGIFSFQCSIW